MRRARDAAPMSPLGPGPRPAQHVHVQVRDLLAAVAPGVDDGAKAVVHAQLAASGAAPAPACGRAGRRARRLGVGQRWRCAAWESPARAPAPTGGCRGRREVPRPRRPSWPGSARRRSCRRCSRGRRSSCWGIRAPGGHRASGGCRRWGHVTPFAFASCCALRSANFLQPRQAFAPLQLGQHLGRAEAEVAQRHQACGTTGRRSRRRCAGGRRPWRPCTTSVASSPTFFRMASVPLENKRAT